MKKIFLMAIILASVGCTDDENTIRTLNAAGYTNIHTTGYDPWSCGKDDTFSTGFLANNPSGTRVKGTVCCGLLKGCTIRF